MDPSLDAGGSRRIAVLIDADNTSARYAEPILDELAKYGTPTIKRAYGDFSSSHLSGWKKQLNQRAIRAMQQHAYTTGKNSTDSALIIDAMDLLYSGNVEVFALVSSDSDFTGLAVRLRESGKTVIGIGRRKTPASLQNACDRFVMLEVLDQGGTEGDPEPAPAAEPAPAEEPEEDAPTLNLQSVLIKAAAATARDDGWSTLSDVGNHLSRSHASFDPRSFGYAKLSALVGDQPFLETEKEDTHLLLRPKQARKRATKRAPAKKSARSATSRSATA